MGKINASDKTCLKTRKKRENVEIKRHLYIKLHKKIVLELNSQLSKVS